MMFTAYGLDGICRQVVVTPTSSLGSSGNVNISDSVGAGGTNKFEDVRTIQDALNQVPAVQGGPDPDLDVDGFVGPKTLGAIRQFQIQACGYARPDRRVDVDKRTHQKLREYYVEPNPYHLKLVYLRLAEAVRWMTNARRALMMAQLSLNGAFAASPKSLRIVNKYFHLDTLNVEQAQQAIKQIDQLYQTAITCIGHSSPMTREGTGYFQEDTKQNTSYAYTYSGGYHMGPKSSKDAGYVGPLVRADAIYICSRRFTSHSLTAYTMLIVHELAHFCGPARPDPKAILDHSYRRKGQSFFELSAQRALTTADCYAHFAGEVTLGREAPFL